MEQIKKIKIEGTLNYINQFKKLIFKLTDAEAEEIKNELETLKGTADNFNIPLKLSNDGNYYLTVSLSKYEKPRIEKYEQLVKKKLSALVLLSKYSSDEYGNGACLRCLRYNAYVPTLSGVKP